MSISKSQSPQHEVRVYADTSVFGGVFYTNFAIASKRFFDQVRRGRIHLLLSAVVEDELSRAPDRVRRLYDEIYTLAEFAPISSEAKALQSAYLNAGIVAPSSRLDALHVALATVSRCGTIVSWNFRHIVNSRRIPLYNGVNMAAGLNAIAIYSPLELVSDEEEDL